jgi:putative hydrolase of the HAD superfamily
MDRVSLPNIKAVILDYGEVLCYPPTAEDWKWMAGLFRVEPDRFRSLWGRNRLDYDCGSLSLETYWSQLAEAAGIKLPQQQIDELSQRDVQMWARLNPTMLEWLKQLHSSGIKTGLLSNMPVDMIMYARKQFEWLNQFDHQTFSAEVRVVKPDAAIYRHSLAGLGVKASEALFVDDRAPNIEGAKGVGLNTIQFKSVAQLRADLERLGFPVLPSEAS